MSSFLSSPSECNNVLSWGISIKSESRIKVSIVSLFLSSLENSPFRFDLPSVILISRKLNLFAVSNKLAEAISGIFALDKLGTESSKSDMLLINNLMSKLESICSSCFMISPLTVTLEPVVFAVIFIGHMLPENKLVSLQEIMLIDVGLPSRLP